MRRRMAAQGSPLGEETGRSVGDVSLHKPRAPHQFGNVDVDLDAEGREALASCGRAAPHAKLNSHCRRIHFWGIGDMCTCYIPNAFYAALWRRTVEALALADSLDVCLPPIGAKGIGRPSHTRERLSPPIATHPATHPATQPPLVPRHAPPLLNRTQPVEQKEGEGAEHLSTLTTGRDLNGTVCHHLSSIEGCAWHAHRGPPWTLESPVGCTDAPPPPDAPLPPRT